MRRYLARQFARPSGLVGRLFLGPWLDLIAAPMNRLAFAALELRAGERVLEIGFGGGGLLRELLRKDTEVEAVDISDAMLARARRRFAREIGAGRLHLRKGSAQSLPLADAAVDKACSVNSIYFWPDLAEAMAELARVVRPGGTLALCFEPADEMRTWPGHRFGFRLVEPEEVRGLIEGAGFGPVRTTWGRGRKPARFCCLSAGRLGATGPRDGR